MDSEQEHTWPGLERLGAAERDLEGEAMFRRLSASMFGTSHAPVLIGRFRVLETLGQGGMGVVYAAEDSQLDRRVAIKVIRDDRLRDGPKDRARLLREARMQAKLSHPNVVQIHEVNENDGGLFIVMELVRGATLRQWLDRQPRSLAAILERFVEAARGLSAAHRVGIVHRDFKLANALVGEDDRVRIADFGLALGELAEAETHPDRASAGAGASAATSRYAGTPAYMSPEQVRGLACDARSDQYSFAVALSEAVFRRAPPPALDRLAEHASTPALPADRAVPQWLRRALERALALDPADRHPSMDALVDVLLAAPRRRRRQFVALGLVAALGTATAVGAAFSGDSPQSSCAPADQRIAGLWDDARRSGLADAFAATDLPYAADSWRRASAGLDEYAERWAAAGHDNCAATRLRGEQSERMFDLTAACLARHRTAWTTLLDSFAQADVALVADAEDLIAALPDPQQCRAAAARQAELGGLARASDDKVRTILDRAKIFTSTHQGREAVALLGGALPGIREAGDVGGEAEALLLLGKSQGRLLRDGPGAVRSLHLAYDRAIAGGRTDLTWEVWNELARASATLFDAPAEARTWLAHAQAAQPSDSPVADAALLSVESEILLAEHKPADAVALRRSSLGILQSYWPAGHPELTLARQALAAGLGEAERLDEARAQHLQLLDELRARFGADHPAVARVEMNLGLDVFELGQHAEARGYLEHARAVLARTYGAVHPLVAGIDVTLGQLDLEGDDLARATARVEGALAGYDVTVPRAHTDRVTTLAFLSELYRQGGQLPRHLAVSQELLDIHDADPGRSAVDLAGVLANIGDHLCELGRCPEALPYFNRLMALQLDAPPEEPALRALPLRGMGLVYAAKGQPELAIAFLEQALEILERSPDDRLGMADVMVATMRELADALAAARRDPARVRELRKRAAAAEAAAAE
ncbi:serine/threonine-protein kinase [Nannocystis radixulma]|uniref:Serine/threonine-protein kinase n=1 Tax=Nannocystis radixulma TaxID=2995305 RepID=A0ABT5BD32_9BACT|nr:serine/threonine-protein kinase [Nannocystis radixulma]MDC0672026.1 serine/threonine-protein kinase [Nannocystis radixulma]